MQTIYSALSGSYNTWLCKMNQNECSVKYSISAKQLLAIDMARISKFCSRAKIFISVFAEVEGKMLGTQSTAQRQ
jgi:hypothetical protein